MVGCDRHIIADHRAHLLDILADRLHTLGRQAHMRERVHHFAAVAKHLELIAGIAAPHAARPRQRSPHAAQLVHAEVHLQHGKAAIDALLQGMAHLLAGGPVGRIAVHAHPVAELAAGQHKRRHIVRLAGQVHQRHLDAAHAAALAAMEAELLDLAKHAIDVARVFADQVAPQR